LYGNTKPDINLNKPIANNTTIINYINNSNIKPKLTSIEIKAYKKDKTLGLVYIGTGVIIQGVAVWTFVKCYEQPININKIKIKDSKISVHQHNSGNAHNVKLGVITGGLALVGLGLEIAGGIQIHRANIGLGRITYNF